MRWWFSESDHQVKIGCHACEGGGYSGAYDLGEISRGAQQHDEPGLLQLGLLLFFSQAWSKLSISLGLPVVETQWILYHILSLEVPCG